MTQSQTVTVDQQEIFEQGQRGGGPDGGPTD